MRSRHSLVKLLAPYACRLVRQIEPGFELWETGWGAPFTLFPEGGGYYGEQQLPRIHAVISKTKPADWTIDTGRQVAARRHSGRRADCVWRNDANQSSSWTTPCRASKGS